jgi:predicted nucleic acid-binding protein
VIEVLADASVILKWFHTDGEAEVIAAQALLRAHRAEQIRTLILDLAVYELGNVLARSLAWPAAEVADQLDELMLLCGPALQLLPEWRRDAAQLAEQNGLTFYDAAYAAAARGLQISLVSADRELLRVGLAESISGFAERLRLP